MLSAIREQICAATCPSVWKTGEPQPHSELCHTLHGIRPEVWAFALLMGAELDFNNHKPGWKQDTPHALLQRLRQEVEELDEAMQLGGALVAEESADVANFAMMIADVCGGLVGGAEQLQAANAERNTYRAALIRISEYVDNGNWTHGVDGDDCGSWTTCDGRDTVRAMIDEVLNANPLPNV